MTPSRRPGRPQVTSRTRRKADAKPRDGERRPAARKRSAASPGTGKPIAPAPLTPTQRRYLRSLCHGLKPVVMLGNKGITDNLKTELGLTLDDHELVKVKLSGGDRDERQAQLDALLAASNAELVQQIGHVASLFRRNTDKPRLALPA